jgi:hypothetical protein
MIVYACARQALRGLRFLHDELQVAYAMCTDNFCIECGCLVA